MEMIDFKNRLFQFQETHLPERKQVLLTVLLILLFCLLLYHGLFRTRWEKEERLEDQIQQFKAELHSPETFGLTWETLEKQRKLLVDESSTLPLIKVDAESLSVRIRELFQKTVWNSIKKISIRKIHTLPNLGGFIYCRGSLQGNPGFS